MNILRRVSTVRLIIAVVAVGLISVVSAVAVTRASGPKPPKRPLAEAIHQALSSPHVQGVTARIKFTNHLLLSGAVPSSSPLISGATGRLWAGDGRVRLELQAGAGDTEITWDGHTLIVYDVSSNTAYELPVAAPSGNQSTTGEKAHALPTVATISRQLTRLAQHVTLSGAIPGDIAGRPSYTVRVSPSHDGGLLGAVELAWDANHGVPLRFAIYSQGDSSPVLSLAVTDISYGPVSSSALAAPMAPGAKVVKVQQPSQPASAAGKHQPAVTGVAAVAHALPFRLSAPASLVGVPRQTVRLVDWSGTPEALVVYGHGLGAIAVLEQASSTSTAGHPSPFGSLPRVSIGGASGHELATALGTVVQFDRGGIRYTLIGSLPAAAAEAAARAIG
ncbi:MAG: LolA family protein [Gaiellales bacterium]